MRTVINKIFWDYEKEENWLNEMSAKGLALVDYFLIRYVFSDSAPGEYIYRIELLKERGSRPESKKYIAFMEESGAEHIASYMWWAYFRRRASEGRFDIYSDIDSKIAYYKRIRNFYFCGAAAQAAAGLYNIALFFIFIDGFLMLNFVTGIAVACLSAAFVRFGMKTRVKIQKLSERRNVSE